MTRTARAHFDGTKLILDEPVDLPIGAPLLLTITVEADISRDAQTLNERLAALGELCSLAVPGAAIPDEALRRENMYGDDGQ